MSIQKKCRICLWEEYDVLPISEALLMTREKEKVPIYAFLKKIYNYVIIPNDGLPDHICLRCFTQVQFSYELFLKCRKSQAILAEFAIEQVTNDDLMDKTDESEDNETDYEYVQTNPESDGSWEDINEEAEEHEELNYETDPNIKRKFNFNTLSTKIEKEYMCAMCTEIFPKKRVFRDHYEQKHMPPFYKCPNCREKFHNQIEYKHHLVTHTPFENCSICNKKFNTVKAFLRHKCKGGEA